MKKTQLLLAISLCLAVGQTASAKTCFDPHIGKTYKAGETYAFNSSWYGPGFQGNPTASGKKFNQHDPSMVAHKVLPFGTRIAIYNPKTRKTIFATVYDDGPHIQNRQLDVSKAGAESLGFMGAGTTNLEVTITSIPKSGKCRK